MPGRYGGAPNAFMQGAQFQQQRRMAAHRENALNALIQRFGPEAGDPTAWGQAEGIQQRQQLFPHQLGAAERSTAAHTANVEQYGPVAGDPQAHGIQQARSLELRQAALAGAMGLRQAKQAGGDLGAAYDRMTAVLPALGFDPQEMAQIREHIIANPDFVDEFVAMLGGAMGGGPERAMSGGQAFYDAEGNLVFGVPMSGGGVEIVRDAQGRPYRPANTALAEGRLDLGQSRHEWDQTRQFLPTPQQGVQSWTMPDGRVVSDVVPGSPQEREVKAEIREAQTAARKMIRANTGVVAAGRTVHRDGRRALAALGANITPEPGEDLPRAIRGLPKHIPLARMLTSKVWGFHARNMARNIQAVMDNIGIDKLLEIKDHGSGLGHVPHQQMIQLQSVLGRLGDIDRPLPELIRDMEDVMHRYDEIIALAQQEIDEGNAILSQQQGVSSGFGPQPRATPGGQQQGGEDPELEALLQLYGGAQ
jgi:hypothetical protein